AEIRGFNRFWSIHMTIIFITYIVLICYLMYGFVYGFTVENLNPIQQSPFIFFGTSFFALLLAICSIGSVMVNRNGAIFMSNKRFIYSIQKGVKLDLVSMLKVCVTSFTSYAIRDYSSYRLCSTEASNQTYP